MAALIVLRDAVLGPTPQSQAIIKAGLVPPLIACVADSSNAMNQVLAGWVLANIAAGTTEETSVLVKHGEFTFVCIWR